MEDKKEGLEQLKEAQKVAAEAAEEQAEDHNAEDGLEDSEGEEPKSEAAQIDWLQLVKDADSSSSSWFDTSVRNQMQIALNMFNGRHSPGSRHHSELFKHRSNYYVPKTRANLRKHEATASQAYFSTMDVLSIDAYDQSDKSELAAADYYKSILNLRLTSNGPKSISWFKTLIGAYQDSMLYGITISRQDWDFKNDKPSIRLISPENFRFSANCDWMDPVNSSPFLIEKIPMYVGEIKGKIKKGEFLKLAEGQIESAKRADSNPISQARNTGRTDPMNISTAVKDFDLVWVHLNIVHQLGMDWVYYTLGTDAFLSVPTPIEEMFLHGERPYVIGSCVIESHKNYPTPLPWMTRDLQRNLNDLVNARMDGIMAALHKRWAVKRGANVDLDSLMRDIPGSSTMLNNPETDVKPLTTPDVSQTSFKEQSLLEIAMDDVSGGFNSSTMQANRSLNETVGGMNLISQTANQVAEYQLKTFNESWVEPVLRQILLLEQYYQDDQTLIMMAGRNADIVKNYGTIHYNDIKTKDLKLSVQVGMGATNPATKVEKMMMALRSIQQAIPNAVSMLNSNEVLKELFGALGFKDGARFINLEEVDLEKEQLKQQVQALEQELANKRNPEIDAADAQLKRAQAMKIGVDATFGAVQAAKMIAQIPAVSPIADKIMEASGYLPPVEGGVDPNLPQPNQPVSGTMAEMAASDPSSIDVAQQQALSHDMMENTNPLTPLKATSGSDKGVNKGIESGGE